MRFQSRALALRWLTAWLTMLLTALTSAPAPAQLAAGEDAWKMLQFDGYQIAYQCRGQSNRGDPVVVLTPSGAHPSQEIYKKILPQLARSYKTCFYDRPGFGNSGTPQAGKPLTLQDFDNQLHALVQAEAANDRIVLVSFSLGTQSVRHYAAAHPLEVAGLLLIDPIHEDWLAQLKNRMSAADWGRMESILDWFLQRFGHDYRDSQAGVKAAALPASLPVRIISRGLPFYRIGLTGVSEEGVKIFNDAHDALQPELLKLTAKTARVVAARSEHMIADSEPELVLTELARLMADAQTAEK